jgi:hyperosmotically inducible periplasmic protein
MRSKITLQLALASQILFGSAGLYLLTPPQAFAQDQQQPATETKADRDMLKKIRRSVVSDKTLSTEAHNVHIVVNNGAVTLDGSVKSDDEKKAVEDKATQIAGAGKVTDNLTVGAK